MIALEESNLKGSLSIMRSIVALNNFWANSYNS